jgi:hypothetical protein
MNEDHEPGRCGACHEDTQVRWKNLYTIGSEGTWLCMPCEMRVVNLIREMSMQAMRDKKAKIMRKKMAKHARKQAGQSSWLIGDNYAGG